MVEKITKTKIIEQYLNNYNRSYYLRELAEKLNKPHQSIKPYLNSLVKENILIENKRKKITEYRLNLKNSIITDCFTIAEKERLAKKLEKDPYLKALYEKLSPEFSSGTFIIFGSSVEKIRKESDIDLLIISKKKISKNLKDFEDTYNRKVHKIQVKNIREITPALIKEIYKKHLILNNTESIIKYFGELNAQNKLV